MKNKISILFLFFLPCLILAQQKDTTTGEIKNSLVKGSWSLQFEVGYSFTLNSFDNLLFSLKYHFNGKNALRFGIGINTNVSNGNVEENVSETDITNYTHDYILLLNYLIYPLTKSNIHLFFGAGPRFRFHNSRHDYYEEGTYKHLSWAAGIDGVFGVEWFAVKNISFIGEYHAFATYGRTTNERSSNGGTEKTTTNDFNFNGGNARLGLSVYFNSPF